MDWPEWHSLGMPPARNLSGFRFGRLIVQSRGPQAFKRGSGHPVVQWICVCDCEKEITVRGESLRSGNTTSCGCFHKERLRANFYTHGQSGTVLYQAWRGMKTRCYNPNSSKYPDYGGRGVDVCPEWLDSFEAFARDMGQPPPGTSLDRIDNEKGYSLGNCRWATLTQQARNKRSVALIEVDRQMLTAEEYAVFRGVRPKALYKHMSRYGLSATEAADKILALRELQRRR